MSVHHREWINQYAFQYSVNADDTYLQFCRRHLLRFLRTRNEGRHPVNKEQSKPDSPGPDGFETLRLERTIKGAGRVEAEGYQTPEGFVVLKGSRISPVDDDTIFPGIRARRKEVKVDSEWILQEDVLCRSPSFAAMLVIGKHANGLTSWKTADGRTLKSMETT